MSTIWKYPLGTAGMGHDIPHGGIVRHVGEQDGALFVWVEVTPEAAPTWRDFEVVGTGHLIRPGRIFLGTVMQPPFVWHVFEVTP